MVTTHFLPTEQALNANSNANTKYILLTCLTVLGAVYNDTTGFISFIFFSSITFTVLTITCFVICLYAMTQVIAFFTKSIAHNYLYKSLQSHSANFFHHFLIIFLLLNVVEEFVRVFSSPSTTIFNSPITCLYLPIKRNFIFHRERWYVPY